MFPSSSDGFSKYNFLKSFRIKMSDSQNVGYKCCCFLKIWVSSVYFSKSHRHKKFCACVLEVSRRQCPKNSLVKYHRKLAWYRDLNKNIEKY